MPMSETSSKQLMYCMAHRTVGSLVLLPRGAYPGTGKHYWVVSVQKNENKYTRRSVQCQVNRLPRRVLLVAARLLSPWLKPGVLRRDLINWRGECLESHPANALRASFAQAGCKVVPID